MSRPRRRKPPGATNRNGYGPMHKSRRAQLAPAVATGNIACARCGNLIRPGQAWDLDHTDDRTGLLGPSHRSCNRAAGADKMNKARRRPGEYPYRWSRRWYDDPPTGTINYNGPSATAEVCTGNGRWVEVDKAQLDNYLTEKNLK